MGVSEGPLVRMKMCQQAVVWVVDRQGLAEHVGWEPKGLTAWLRGGKKPEGGVPPWGQVGGRRGSWAPGLVLPEALNQV